MVEHAPDDDDRLLVELADALGPDPVPHGLAAISKALSTWADVDAELAELLESEATPELVGVRGADTIGSALVFHLDDDSVVIEVDVHDGLNGTVMPAGADVIELESVDGTTTSVPLDALGQFDAPGGRRGIVRLRLTGPSGRPIVTDWFVA